jgi:outer membrane protein OmpA-like peptidoglycan-associated protein
LNHLPPILLFVSAALSGCAATIPELVSARNAYEQAAAGPAATLVPAELHKAQQALQAAEAAHKDDRRGFQARDLAYVAQRKAETAEALASRAAGASLAKSADAQYQATQDVVMRNTKAALGASQDNLAASESAGAVTSARLATSETARLEAEDRASAAMEALARLAAVKEEARGLVITLSGSVLFRSNESTLTAEARTRLGEVADALLATRERSILIEGHTDAQGSDAQNLDLSQRRADAVRSFLVERGYDRGLVRAVGVGEGHPLADNDTDEGRANNRRVEIVVLPAGATATP